MYTNNSARKAIKGSVQIKSSNNRLQLVFSAAGKRHYLSTGLADTPVNRKLAERKATLIEDDIFKERFDPTLQKYKPQSALTTVTPTFTPIEPPKTSLLELWEQYTEFKIGLVAKTTIVRDYGKVEKRIRQFPAQTLDDALDIQVYGQMKHQA
jgi:integrase